MPRSRLACLLGYTALAKWLPQVPQSDNDSRFCACGGDVRGVRKEDRTPGRQDAEGASLQLQVQRDEPGQGLGEARAQGQSSLEPGDERSLPGEDLAAGESVLAGRGDDVPQEGNYANEVRGPGGAKPMACKDGHIMEHRLLMAGKVGRLLTRTRWSTIWITTR